MHTSMYYPAVMNTVRRQKRSLQYNTEQALIRMLNLTCYYISLCVRNRLFVFPTRSDTKRHAQAQKMARGWKVRILKEEELYYPCSENKGANLRG